MEAASLQTLFLLICLNLCGHRLEMYPYYKTDDQIYEDQRDACKSLGYDGLAITCSPEEHKDILQRSEHYRATTSRGVFVGLIYNTSTGDANWDDGTPYASDMPWESSNRFESWIKYGRLDTSGVGYIMGGGGTPSYAFCGNYKKIYKQVEGKSYPGKQPAGVNSILSTATTSTYMRCVSLCGRNCYCRTVEFNLNIFTCTLFGPSSYTSLESNPSTKTFVRNGYP